MPAGDAYELAGSGVVSPISPAQRADLTRVVERARSISGYGFGVYVGPLPEGRDSAVTEHASLRDPASALLIAVDPSERAIEIVTGVNVAVNLDDRSCELAVLAMTSCFVADDLVGGIREGVTLLAQHARHPRVLHLDEPA